MLASQTSGEDTLDNDFQRGVDEGVYLFLNPFGSYGVHLNSSVPVLSMKRHDGTQCYELLLG